MPSIWSRLTGRQQFLAAARAYSAAAVEGAHGEHQGGIRLWKILSFLVALPGVGVCLINATIKEKEEKEHHVRPEFVPYSHLRLRSKKFPWGDGNHTLFHNPHVNALPEGYEEVDEHH
jgi:cytochrome c oxidase subunit 6a